MHSFIHSVNIYKHYSVAGPLPVAGIIVVHKKPAWRCQLTVVVIMLKCLSVPNQHLLPLKQTQCYMSITSQWKKAAFVEFIFW